MGERAARRDPLDRLRRQGPAPGRRRQDHPRGAEHDVEHLRQVDLQGRRALLLPRPARGRQGRARLEVQGRLRRAAARRGQSRSDTYPTIRIGEDDVDVGHEATVSKVGEEQLFYLKSHGIDRGGGGQADRQRLHRADRQGAADGVRGRDEPPDRAADGRLHWLSAAVPDDRLTLDARRQARRRAAALRRAARPPRRRRAGSSRRSTSSTSTPSRPRRAAMPPPSTFELAEDAVTAQRRGGGLRGPARDVRWPPPPSSHPELVERHLGSVVTARDAVHGAQRRPLDRRRASSTCRATCTSRRRSSLTTVA